MLKRAFAAAGVVLVLVLGFAGLDHQSVVDGHILRCSGLYVPHDYAGGTVRVLEGTDALWSHQVASEAVPDGGGTTGGTIASFRCGPGSA